MTGNGEPIVAAERQARLRIAAECHDDLRALATRLLNIETEHTEHLRSPKNHRRKWSKIARKDWSHGTGLARPTPLSARTREDHRRRNPHVATGTNKGINGYVSHESIHGRKQEHNNAHRIQVFGAYCPA